MRMKLTTLLERDEIPALLRIDEENTIPYREQTTRDVALGRVDPSSTGTGSG
jgi:hypothetical protein